MDYKVKRNDGKTIWYKLVGDNVVPVQVQSPKGGDSLTNIATLRLQLLWNSHFLNFFAFSKIDCHILFIQSLAMVLYLI